MDDCDRQDESLRDSLGRRRTLGQTRGLRPLYPALDRNDISRSIRVAMTQRAWAALDRAITNTKALTRPRAIGDLLERALGTSQTVDWQEWQIRKEKQLLEEAS